MSGITQSNRATEKTYLNADITDVIIGHAIEVHNALGPGLLESVYETCLAHELTKCGLKIERQKPLPVVYKGLNFDQGFRLDLLVEGKVLKDGIKRIAC